MRITYIKLSNFKRFPLSDIEVFEKDFNTKLITIVGCNGSGKSSLLRELSPLPSLKENYNLNGYKEIHIKHNNNFYVLISDFTSGSRFSFVVNDEELNPSGLISIQRELVNKHFSITEEVYELLIGLTSFSSLTMQQRKKLFNNISPINIDSLLEKYDAIKTEITTYDNLLKIQQNTYNVEKEKLTDASHITKLQEQKSFILSVTECLLTLKTQLLTFSSTFELEQVYKVYAEQISKLEKFLTRYSTYITAYPIANHEKLYTTFTNQKADIELKLQLLYKQLEGYIQKLTDAELIQNNDKVEIEKRIEHLLNENKLLLSRRTFDVSTDIDIDSYLTAIYKAETQLSLFLHEVKSNEYKEFTTSKQEEIERTKQSLLNELRGIEHEENKLRQEVQHMNEHTLNTDATCPKCNTTFNVSFIQAFQNKAEHTQKLIQTKKQEISRRIEVIDVELSRFYTYFTQLKQFSAIKSSLPVLSTLWKYIEVNNLYNINPSNILSLVRTFNNDVEYIRLIQTNEKELVSLRKTLSILNISTHDSKVQITSSIAETEKEIDELFLQKSLVTNNLTNLNNSKIVYNALKQLLETLKTSLSNLYSVNQNYVSRNLLNVLNEELVKQKTLLLEIDIQLSDHSKLTSILSKYEKDIEDTQLTLNSLNLMQKELSPKNGLIAKILSQYLNSIIRFMNTTINSVMEYKLNIDLIDVDENVLDYKFRFTVENKVTVIDISKASSGMQEIIDLSFKLVFYKLLKLDNYPLYLDEFGVRLDSTHKTKIHNLIFKFINNSNFSQVFLVTHTDVGFLNYKESTVITL